MTNQYFIDAETQRRREHKKNFLANLCALAALRESFCSAALSVEIAERQQTKPSASSALAFGMSSPRNLHVLRVSAVRSPFHNSAPQRLCGEK
jgi:hypothetical protein